MSPYLQINLQNCTQVQERVISSLRQMQLYKAGVEVMVSISRDANINMFDPGRICVFHGDFVYTKGLPMYRINTDLNLDVASIKLTTKDFADPTDFIKASFMYHDIHAETRPLIAFLERTIHWLARTFPHLPLTVSTTEALPSELTANHWFIDPSEPTMTTGDRVILEKYMKRNEKYTRRINAVIFIGSI